MTNPPRPATIRTFRPGDGARIAEGWTEAAPGDGITAERFRDLVLLDRNFDANGLFIAEVDGELAGSVYAVRRRIAVDADDLEPASGWLPYLFVRPRFARRGIGSELVSRAKTWLAEQGATTAYFSSYTPNYFLPGLDADRYPEAARLFSAQGFATQYQSVAMDRSLNDYVMPHDVRGMIDGLRSQGYRFGSPSGDDLVDLIDIAGSRFNPDWSRGIREGVLGGMPLERIITVRDPHGTMLGWAMHGTYENVLERFGPFGVLPESRGTGLGKVLLHLTLERMRALGAHSAWFLWTDEESAAGQLYLKTGFTITRTFSILHAPLG
jgi:GNAT superfamily N-acetyltransferase